MATARTSSVWKRSVSRYAVAPGVTTMAMTRMAPTVCSAATVQAARSAKNRSCSARGLMPTVRAWLSSKNTSIRSFHLSSRIASDTAAMITTCSASSSEMPRMLPMTIDWMLTEVGQIDTMNSPSAKNEVKMMPMMASSRSLVRWRTSTMDRAARMPAKNAPSE